MPLPTGVWGVDLGQCALKALRLEVLDGQVTATAFDYVEHPKILSQPDADPDQLTREALEKFLSRNTLKGDSVAISVPGSSGLARFVKLPPVEEKKIGDIVKFEAKQQIPFNLDEVVWDYQKVSSGVVTDGFALETEIGLFAMKRDMVNRYLQHFKDVNVEVHVVQMAPLCLCNYVSYDLLNVGADTEAAESVGKKQCVVALDIGADASNLVVTDGQRIIWQRPIPLGGNHFTRALTKDLKLTFAKAEHLKRNATKSGPELKKILTALKPVLNDFAGEVQRSLGYFTNTHRDAQIEYMVGLGSAFRLPGLQRFLAEKLQLDVRKLQKLERLSGEAVTAAPAFTENVLSFAVAYGLAIQGLKVARLQTNLLPPEIRTERLVRAKKPWAAAAAAALLLGTAGLAWSYALEYRSVDTTRSPLKEAVADATSAKSLFDGKMSAFKKQQEAADNEEKAVRSIVAGTDEKLNWIDLNRFIGDNLPRPDGKNLLIPRDNVKWWGKWWGEYRAGEAARKYNEMLADPKPGQRLDTTAIDRALIQFNVESLDARFTDDLAAYWTRVKTELGNDGKFWVRPASEWDNVPKEKEGGWVVELRGYTYHADGRNFVPEVLVEQLALAAGVRAAAPPAAGTTPVAPAATGVPAAPAPTDPVVGRVSHVVLYKVDDTGTLDLRHTGYVAALTGGAGAAAGGGAPGAAVGGGMMGASGGGGPKMPAPAGASLSGAAGSGMQGLGGGNGGAAVTPGRAAWTPIVSSLAGSSSSGAATGANKGMMGGLPSAPPTGSYPGLPSGNRPPQEGNKPESREKAATRTEFVILFIWKENTPSDKLRPTTEIPATEASPAGGMMGGSGMMGAGGGAGGSNPTPPPAKGGAGGDGGDGIRGFHGDLG